MQYKENAPLVMVQDAQENILKVKLLPEPEENHLPTYEEIKQSLRGTEYTFTPRTLEEYTGQEEAKLQINMLLNGVREFGKIFPHLLLFGYAGIGKTTLARVIANELGYTFKAVTGATVKTEQELYNIICEFTQSGNPTLLFIDEIHALGSSYQLPLEIWLPILAEKLFYHNIKGLESPIEVPPFTCIGATTDPGLLSEPLRQRFRLVEMDMYTDNELAEVAERHLGANAIIVDVEESMEIAKRSRGIPRTAIQFSQLLTATHKEGTILEIEDLTNFFSVLKIAEDGITKKDLQVLQFISDSRKGAVGLAPLCSALRMDKQGYLEMYEPFLLWKGFITITSRGRELTDKGLARIDKRIPSLVHGQMREASGVSPSFNLLTFPMGSPRP